MINFNDGLYNLYREVDELSLLNKLFTTILSEKMNIMNYEANTTIQNKLYLKDTLNELIYLLDDSSEDLKSLIKIKKGYPIYKLDDIELISVIKTKVAGEYKENIVVDNLKSEINIIISLIKEIISKLDDSNSYESLSVLSNISFQLKKALLNIS